MKSHNGLQTAESHRRGMPLAPHRGLNSQGKTDFECRRNDFGCPRRRLDCIGKPPVAEGYFCIPGLEKTPPHGLGGATAVFINV